MTLTWPAGPSPVLPHLRRRISIEIGPNRPVLNGQASALPLISKRLERLLSGEIAAV